jgi:hypothetical protein
MRSIKGEINSVRHEMQRANAHDLVGRAALDEPEHSGFQPLFEHALLSVAVETRKFLPFLRQCLSNLPRPASFPLTSSATTAKAGYIEEAGQNILEDYILIVHPHCRLVARSLEVLEFIREIELGHCRTSRTIWRMPSINLCLAVYCPRVGCSRQTSVAGIARSRFLKSCR